MLVIGRLIIKSCEMVVVVNDEERGDEVSS